jgi:hypothetical protein
MSIFAVLFVHSRVARTAQPLKEGIASLLILGEQGYSP